MRTVGGFVRPPGLSLAGKLWRLNWMFVLLICLIGAIGFAMQYSVAKGLFEPWVMHQMTRFAIGFVVMLTVALIDVRLWLRYAYPCYFAALGLLAAVELVGSGVMGAQRWISFGYFSMQPSELMKIALVLSLARYFHGVSPGDVGRPGYLIVPLAMVAVPVALVLRQPDLGTAVVLAVAGGAILFLAGLRLWMFAGVLVAGLASIPVTWQFLHAYQKQRIMAFLNPESDPLGAGYHILQSKIALGSGGVFGRGFMQGSQSQLHFLPETQTDFIFTTLAEELGIVGGLVLMGLYLLVLIYGFMVSFSSHNQFGRLVGMGVTTIFFLHVFINIAMVMGLIPVVGVPLPLISYGGTAMVALLFGLGLLMSVDIHRDVRMGRRGAAKPPW